MKRINICINESLHDRLKQLSQQTGISVSEMLRRAADAMYGEKVPPTKTTRKPRKP